MDIVRCNWCEHIFKDRQESCHCSKCGRNDCIMELDGTETYYSDEQIKKLWALLGNIPIDPISECIEEPFLYYPAGTFREDVWDWFDERYSFGVYGLMYR